MYKICDKHCKGAHIPLANTSVASGPVGLGPLGWWKQNPWCPAAEKRREGKRGKYNTAIETGKEVPLGPATREVGTAPGFSSIPWLRD